MAHEPGLQAGSVHVVIRKWPPLIHLHLHLHPIPHLLRPPPYTLVVLRVLVLVLAQAEIHQYTLPVLCLARTYVRPVQSPLPHRHPRPVHPTLILVLQIDPHGYTVPKYPLVLLIAPTLRRRRLRP